MSLAEDITTVDQNALREALGTFATGVVVVTTLGNGGAPVGLTVNSFNSVSLDPPLILWSIRTAAPSIAAFRNHPAFAVNVLCAEQQAMAEQFAAAVPDRFDRVTWKPGLKGVPVIDGTIACLQCRAHARYPGGDHEIHLGEVAKVDVRPGAPLLYIRGDYVQPGY